MKFRSFLSEKKKKNTSLLNMLKNEATHQPAHMLSLILTYTLHYVVILFNRQLF